MRTNEEIRMQLEELGLTDDQIDIAMATTIMFPAGEDPDLSSEDRIFALQQKLNEVPDYREKARIQAQIISEKIGKY